MNALLSQPILEDGLRSIHFFNGRLLSGEDMTTEKAANLERLCRIGQAVGTGIAHGLEVSQNSKTSSADRPVLTVTKGLAVNPCGHALSLPAPVDVTLVRSRPASPNGNEPFRCCAPLKAGARLAGTGVYLLTIEPAHATEGRAPVSGLDNERVTCNSKYVVEGTQFNLVELELPAAVFDLARLRLLRNHVAYECFGAAEIGALPADPLGAARFGTYGFLDKLRPDSLSNCEVPLAVVFWTDTEGLKFIDQWSVRRRLVRPSADGVWPLFSSDRRAAEGEGMFLQFDEHARDLLKQPEPAKLVAGDHFRFLPPVGLLPITGSAGKKGFDPMTFFGPHASRDVAMLDGSVLRALVRDSFLHQPIDLTKAGKVQLYRIWENHQAVSLQPSVQPTLVFATAALPYRGVARFGHAVWDVSRVAPAVI